MQPEAGEYLALPYSGVVSPSWVAALIMIAVGEWAASSGDNSPSLGQFVLDSMFFVRSTSCSVL